MHSKDEGAPTSSDEPRVPESFHGFCFGCFYDLRGLIEPRCPECGRSFDPSIASTFSLTPHSDRLRKNTRRAMSALAGTLKSISPPDQEASRRMDFARQLLRLKIENDALHRHLATLTSLLASKGVLDSADLDAIDREVEQTIAGPAIIDDTASANEPAETTPDLLELDRALHERRDAI